MTMQTNLQIKMATTLQNNAQAQPENIQNKMTSLWQEKNMKTASNIHQHNDVINLSPNEKNKINQFINELKSREDKKEFFAHIFKTMIHLGKDEKQIFVAGVAQTFKSSDDPEMQSLSTKFTKALSRYMSISLMSIPLTNQLNHNISSITLDGDNDDDDIGPI